MAVCDGTVRDCSKKLLETDREIGARIITWMHFSPLLGISAVVGSGPSVSLFSLAPILRMRRGEKRS